MAVVLVVVRTIIGERKFHRLSVRTREGRKKRRGNHEDGDETSSLVRGGKVISARRRYRAVEPAAVYDEPRPLGNRSPPPQIACSLSPFLPPSSSSSSLLLLLFLLLLVLFLLIFLLFSSSIRRGSCRPELWRAACRKRRGSRNESIRRSSGNSERINEMPGGNLSCYFWVSPKLSFVHDALHSLSFFFFPLGNNSCDSSILTGS